MTYTYIWAFEVHAEHVEAFRRFRADYASEYAALDRLCEGFVNRETLIGHFVSTPKTGPV